MSPLLTLLVCLLHFTSTLCQSDKSGIYAIAGLYTSDTENVTFVESSLYKYNTTTGSQTLLYKPDFLWTKNSKSCFDDKLNIWYFLVQKFFNNSDNNGLLDLQIILARYNLETNERLSDIKLAPYFYWINRVDCVGDPNTGDIYLFGNNFTSNHSNGNSLLLQLITDNNDNNYNVEINIIKQYGTSIWYYKELPFIGIQPVFDSKRNRVWFNGGDEEWIYIDIKTGDILAETFKFPFERSAIYDEKLDAIVGLYYLFPYNKPSLDQGEWSMMIIDPVNLTLIDKKNGFKDYCPWYLHSPTIDNNNEIFYEFLAEPVIDPTGNYCPVQPYTIFFVTSRFHLLGIDINDGSILTQPVIDNNNQEPIFSPSDIIYWNGE